MIVIYKPRSIFAIVVSMNGVESLWFVWAALQLRTAHTVISLVYSCVYLPQDNIVDDHIICVDVFVYRLYRTPGANYYLFTA